MADKVRCKKCGGRLVYEEFFQRGRVYNVLPDGTIGKRYKYVNYDFCDVEAIMVYCKSCGDNKVFHLEDHCSRVVVEETDDDTEEWE